MNLNVDIDPVLLYAFYFNLLLGSLCRSPLSYSHTVAPQAVLSLKEIMCCSWRWVGAAPNPKDFGLFLAREVRMIQPKMERNSHWREVEVFQVQRHLCLLEEGKYTLYICAAWKNIQHAWYLLIFICATKGTTTSVDIASFLC